MVQSRRFGTRRVIFVVVEWPLGGRGGAFAVLSALCSTLYFIIIQTTFFFFQLLLNRQQRFNPETRAFLRLMLFIIIVCCLSSNHQQNCIWFLVFTAPTASARNRAGVLFTVPFGVAVWNPWNTGTNIIPCFVLTSGDCSPPLITQVETLTSRRGRQVEMTREEIEFWKNPINCKYKAKVAIKGSSDLKTRGWWPWSGSSTKIFFGSLCFFEWTSPFWNPWEAFREEAVLFKERKTGRKFAPFLTPLGAARAATQRTGKK